MHVRAVIAAVLAGLLVGIPTLWLLGREVARFADPCVQWGASNAAGAELPVTTPGCPETLRTSATKLQAGIRVALVTCGTLAALVLGIAGALYRRPPLTVLGAALLLLESAPLIFSFAWLTVAAGALFLWAAREIGPVLGTSRIGMRLIGTVAAAGSLATLPGLLRAHPLFQVFLLFALLSLAAAGLWPVRRA